MWTLERCISLTTIILLVLVYRSKMCKAVLLHITYMFIVVLRSVLSKNVYYLVISLSSRGYVVRRRPPYHLPDANKY